MVHLKPCWYFPVMDSVYSSMEHLNVPHVLTGGPPPLPEIAVSIELVANGDEASRIQFYEM